MKNSFEKFCLIFLLLSFMSPLLAQKTEKADKLYDDFGYKTSIPLLEANMDKRGMTEEDLFKIANSYRLIHDTEKAEKWYRELVELSDNPIHYLHYAQALQSNGKYELAKKYFLRYDQHMGSNDKRGKLLAEAIDRMNDFPVSDVQIKNEGIINSDKIDFSPAFFEEGIIFVSSRAPSRNSFNKDIWTDDHFMTLFYAESNTEGELKPPTEFSKKISTEYHEGPLTVNRNNDLLFFTKSNYDKKKKKKKDQIFRLNIYTTKRSGDDWENAKQVSFCTDEFDEMHPSLSSDGKSLYFASNREGGFGGMDLYVSTLEAGKWSEPQNLGSEINTSGNESFPFIHEDGTLYFSSDGWGGLGALDIFSAIKVADEYWSEPVNIGLPFNSSKDDFGFILNILGTEGYLSSAREGGMGFDDIYSFQLPPGFIKKPKIIRLTTTVCVYDEQSGERLEDAKVSMMEGTKAEFGFKLDPKYSIESVPVVDGGKFFKVLLEKNEIDSTVSYIDLTQITNENGETNYELSPDKAYFFLAVKDGYQMGRKQYTTEGVNEPGAFSFCIPLAKRQNLSIKGIVTNLTQGNRLPGAEVSLLDHSTNQAITIRSNLLGEFSFLNIKCDGDYTLTATKDGFEKSQKVIQRKGKDCPEGESLDYVLALLSINEQPADGPLTAVVPKTGVEVGTVIELENIYYDFDDYHIREGAAKSLDQLVALLHQYPSMHIELSAHTDSRGHWKYNRTLSKKRAEYARRYLIAKGISARRLKSMGWGESKLRNNCDEGVSCTEEEHQYNRRTEIRVTQFNQEGIPIHYLNNPPEVIHSYRSEGRLSSK